MKHRLFLGALALASGVSMAPAHAQSCTGGYSGGFALGGEVQKPTRFTFADLKKLPSSRVTVTFYSGTAGLVTATYTGVALNDLLTNAVVKVDPSRKNDILRKYVQVRATDCYEAIIAVGDLLPNFGAQQVLIAYATGDGKPLDQTEGMARLIVAGDKAGGRLVSNVHAVIVRTAPSRD